MDCTLICIGFNFSLVVIFTLLLLYTYFINMLYINKLYALHWLFLPGVEGTVMPLFHQRIKPRLGLGPLIVDSLGKKWKKIDQGTANMKVWD